MHTLSGLQSNPALYKSVHDRCTVDDPKLQQTLLGMDFSNPVGLAAGFDKNATAVRAWAALGFGFAEVGTVTPLSQPGN